MQFGPRTLLFVILLLAMPIAAYLLMFKPLNEQKMAAERDTQLKRETLAKLSNQLLHTKDVVKEIDNLKEANALLEQRLPDQKEMDKVLNEIWLTAERNGLTAKSVRALKTTEGPSYNEQTIRMVIDGPFSEPTDKVATQKGFFKFLNDLEQLQRLTRINQMTITADEKNTGQVEADLVLSVYFEPGQKLAGAQ